MRKLLTIMLSLAIISTFASALTINSVDYSEFNPGMSQEVRIVAENELDEDIRDVSITLNTQGTPFTIIGSSQDSQDRIRDDDSEEFSYTLKASSTSKPGDYLVGYTARYKEDNATITISGEIGLTISGRAELEYSISAQTPVVGQQTTVNIRIINKGIADAKFVNVKITPQGFTLLSDPNQYVGTVDSDDYETVSVQAFLTGQNPSINAVIEYTDFDNEKITKNAQLPFTVYERTRAEELGIVKKSNAPAIIIFLILVIAAWIIYRTMKKRRARKKESEKR
jgi:uncharacterized membrane protein